MDGERRPITIFIVAGEESGDQLGAKLIAALRRRLPAGATIAGVGGHAMAMQGVESLFPLSDIAVMGILPVLARLPTIVERVWRTVDAVIAADPDVLVIIDSPDFTHQVAKKAKPFLPRLKVVNYVSPSVWAWRQGRARAMAGYVDHVLALLPFEPEAHRRLGGPACTYVGHPLIERLGELRPAPGERRPLEGGPIELLVLPGSRRSEVGRLMPIFAQTVERLYCSPLGPRIRLTLPAVQHLASGIHAASSGWAIQPQIVQGEAAKLAAFRRAHAALAASGTVTLELGLAGVPMVVTYRVSSLEAQLRHLIKVNSVVLTNLILGRNAVPELLQWDATPDKLANALLPLLSDGEARGRQIEAFEELDRLMALPDGTAPSDRAADVVLELADQSR